MDKRTLLAMFLVILIFMILQTYVFKPKPLPENQNQTTQIDSTKAAAGTAQVSDSTKTAETAKPDTLFKSAAATQTITLSNDKVDVQLSSLGASITSVTMKNFKWSDKKTPVNLVPEGKNIAGIKLLDQKAGYDLKNLNWNVEPADSGKIVFWLGTPEKKVVTKTYSLDDKYGIQMDVAVQSPTAINGIQYDFSAGINDSEHIKTKSKGMDYKLFLMANNELQFFRISKLWKEKPHGALDSFKWAALRTKYFTIAICEKENSLIKNFNTAAVGDTLNPAIVLDSASKQSSNNWNQSFLIYAGPADYDLLRSYNISKLEQIPERGAAWLRWLSNGIAWLLKFLHSFIPNYGIVIIIFSIILKILLTPLTHKSMVASQKMQRIQPQVQELQKMHKNDPKTLQMELSKLYKEAGASPLSGCLPLLLQMPIFFSLYSVLRYTIDMRNASFVGWLNNLSEPDRFYILPIIMAVFMVLQSLMMRPPQADLDKMDDKQKAMQQSQKMMTWMMPIMMLLIFVSVPSGLVLYYTVFNILSVAQQYYLQKHLKQKGI